MSDLSTNNAENFNNDQKTERIVCEFKKVNDIPGRAFARYKVLYNYECEAIDFKIVELNEAYAAIMGWEMNAAVGLLLSSLIADASEDELISKVFHMIQKNPTSVFEFHISPSDRWYRFAGYFIGQEEYVHIFNDVTERRNAETKLLSSEIKFISIFNSTGEAIFLHNAETGKIVDVNDRMLEMFGFDSKDEVFKCTFSDISIVDSEFNAENAFAHVHKATSEDVGPFEWQCKKKNGDIFWVEVSMKYSLIDGNGIVIAVVRDITERKKIMKALSESENRFRLLAENARDMIFRMSLPDAKYEYVSPASFEILGYRPEEIYNGGGTVKNLIHPEFSEWLQEQWNNLMQGIVPSFYEYKIIHRYGQVRWLHQRNVLIRDDKDQPIAIEGIVTDITEMKTAEEILKVNKELLRLQKEKYERLVSMLPVVVCQCDAEFNIEYMNATGGKLFGCDSVKQCSLQLFFPHKEFDKITAKIKTHIPGTMPMQLLTQCKSTENTVIDVIMTVSAFIKNNDSMYYLISLIPLLDVIADSLLPDSKFYLHYDLTSKEKVIIEMLLKGFGRKEILSAMDIAEGTLKKHLFNIYQKLHITNIDSLFEKVADYMSIHYERDSMAFSILKFFLHSK